MDEYHIFPLLILFMIGALTVLAHTLRRMGLSQEAAYETRCQQCGHVSFVGLPICAECRTANALVLANNFNTSTVLRGDAVIIPSTTEYRQLATPTE